MTLLAIIVIGVFCFYALQSMGKQINRLGTAGKRRASQAYLDRLPYLMKNYEEYLDTYGVDDSHKVAMIKKLYEYDRAGKINPSMTAKEVYACIGFVSTIQKNAHI